MKNVPSYVIYDGRNVKKSLVRYVQELQNDVRAMLTYGDPTTVYGRAWAAERPLHGGVIYYMPGEAQACTAHDLQELVDSMFAETLEIFEAWQNELAQGGVSHGYMDRFRTNGSAKMMELGSRCRLFKIFPNGIFPSSREHALAVGAAKRLLKEQRERAVKALQTLGL